MDFGIPKEGFGRPENFSGSLTSRHRQERPVPTHPVDLRTPQHLGGRTYLTSVSPVRDPDAETVHDCVGCRGYVYADAWHLVAGVRSGSATAQYHFCDGGCFREWRRLADR